MAEISRSRVRERRVECGLTQAELASRAGVSRQLVAAVEAGRNAPAVDAALRLARALGSDVESLFATPPPDVVDVLGGRVREGALVRIGRIGDRLVATELPDRGISGAGWSAPDGRMVAGSLELFDRAVPAGMVIAGCDPALGIAEAMLHGLGPASLLATPAPTGTALRALAQGRVHAAVVHGANDELPRAPVPVLRWHLARWAVGLGTAVPGEDGSIEALLEADAPIAQREGAAASQQAFVRAAARTGAEVPRRGPRATGHLDAARIAAGIGGSAVTTEAAAHAFGLRFLALEDHTVEVWIAERFSGHPGADALITLLASSAFTQRAGSFGGYDLEGCGTRIG